MIKSMTGFGRCENLQADKKFTVEMKAVNHRYFDVNIKMPKKLSIFEAAVRGCLKDYIQRGKVDVFITCEDYSDTNYSLKYSENMAREYVNYFRQMAETFGLRDDLTVTALGRCPEVLTLEEQTGDEEEIWAALEKALIGACEQFNASRAREGEALREDLLGKLEHMLDNVDLVEKRYPAIIREYREKLTEKVKELLGDAQMDENRLAAEVVLFSDKI